MPRPAPPRPQAPAPWWLQGGSEECPQCGQRYHPEQERRCAGCDAPSCPHCLQDAHCADCGPEHP